jgi:hypothetical protein
METIPSIYKNRRKKLFIYSPSLIFRHKKLHRASFFLHFLLLLHLSTNSSTIMSSIHHSLNFNLSHHTARRHHSNDLLVAIIQIRLKRKCKYLMRSNDGSITIFNQTQYPDDNSIFPFHFRDSVQLQSIHQFIPSMLFSMDFCRCIFQQVERRISSYVFHGAQEAIALGNNFLDILAEVDVVIEEYYNEDEVVNGVLRDSMNMVEFRGVPASSASIKALKTEVFESREECGSCFIYLDELRDGMVVISLPCSHIFHSNCIKQWLLQSNSCPLCRVQI